MPVLARRFLPASWLLPLVLAASGCSDPNSFAPTCPQSAILPDAGDLTRYRGSGHDVTDLMLSARISAIQGHCAAGEKPGSIHADVQVSLTVDRGPAANGRTVDLMYFIAVTRGETILDKAVFPIHAEFPPNIDELRLAGNPVNMTIPTPKGISGPDYTVTAGFQLTPQELAANRARGAKE